MLKGLLPRPESIEVEVKMTKVYFINAYDYAVKIRNPVFENVVMLDCVACVIQAWV
ncbi:hypothetical protein [Caldivirga maquilingensis]|uniref:hypothetical protein n=1 Tax=Caldivirga maquilingensis TaxID=76887 RepID=UPI000A88E68E|nr:hypothetical protein [Caldivirga maquilingensis]